MAADPARITSLNECDVLLGRGKGPSEYSGNKRFLLIVEERKAEYVETISNASKSCIAEEILQNVLSTGARFLQMVEKGTRVTDSVWQEAPRKAALEKVKQALRQQRGKKEKKASSNVGSTARERVKKRPSESDSELSSLDQANCRYIELPEQVHADSSSCVARPPSVVGLSGGLPRLSFENPTESVISGLVHPSTDAVRNSLLTMAMLSSQLVPFQQQPPLMHSLYLALNAAQQSSPCLQVSGENPMQALTTHTPTPVVRTKRGPLKKRFSAPSSPKRRDRALPSPSVTSAEAGSLHFSANAPAPKDFSKIHSNGSISPGSLKDGSHGPEMEAAVGLSAMSLAATKATMTMEQEEMELATMTDEERVAVLSDLFGKYCGIRQGKRPRKDLDQGAIAFLVGQMRVEVDQIPASQKRALLHALTKCHAEEFSDNRLEQFLRCEGMDTKLAAQRFVRYWECRRQTFGPDKYTMRMTLSEALRDDLAAIVAGVLCLLPFRDSHGRQMLYLNPHRRSRGGYTSANLLRAFWYVMEVLSQDNNDVASGFIFVVNDSEVGFWDYDAVYDRMMFFEMSCWPVQGVGAHQCCPTSILMRVLRPVTDKRLRARTHWHDVPLEQIHSTLSQYGISKDMIPREMNGTVELNLVKWVENRRAVEMEEIT